MALKERVMAKSNDNVGTTGYAGLADNAMLGADGMRCDMLRSAKAAFLAGQATEGSGFDRSGKP